MNDEFRRQALQQQVKGKFMGKADAPQQDQALYPDGADAVSIQRVSWAKPPPGE